jgi:WD40 repeat protein
MFRTPAPFLPLLIAALVFVTAGRGQPPRLDHYGDPLPAGAITRLGTHRFQDPRGAFSIVFSADRKLLASGNWDMAIRVWDTATYRERHRYFVGWKPDGKPTPPDKAVQPAVAFSPDSKTLAGSGADHLAYLWDTISGKEVGRLGGKSGRITALAFAPDGKLLAGACADGSVRLWDVATGRELRALKGHTGSALTVAFSADGKRLASGGADRTVRLWDTKTGKELRCLKGHQTAIHSVLFVLKDRQLASMEEASCVRLWDAVTGKELHKLETFGAGYALARGPNETSLITVAAARIESWDAHTGKNTTTIYIPPQKAYICAALSPDGKTLAAGSSWATVRLLRYPSGEFVRDLCGSDPMNYSVAFSPNGKLLAAGSGDSGFGHRGTRVYLWDLAAGKELRRLDDLLYRVNALAFSPDGRILAIADGDKTIRLWDPATGKERRRLRGHKEMVVRLAFSPDGITLASAGRDSTVRLWDVRTGKQRACHPLKEVAERLAFSPDGKVLAACSDRVSVWEVATGKGRSYPPQEGLVHLWYADGRLLALTHEYKEGDIHAVWDVTLGKRVVAIPVGQSGNGPWTFAVSPDGRTLATGRNYHGANSRTMTVRLYELTTGELRRQFRGHTGFFIEDLAFSADGRRLASGCGDATVLVWGVYGTPGRKPPAALTDEQLKRVWEGLASSAPAPPADVKGGGDVKPRPDAGEHAGVSPAFEAMQALIAVPRQTIPLLKQHLRPVPRLSPGRLTKLLADLGDSRFAVREKATAELEKLDELAEAALRRALEDRPALEVRRRVERLLNRIDSLRGPQMPSERLRTLRALEVLERLGTPEARRLLDALATGEPEAPLTGQARAALERLGYKPTRRP